MFNKIPTKAPCGRTKSNFKIYKLHCLQFRQVLWELSKTLCILLHASAVGVNLDSLKEYFKIQFNLLEVQFSIKFQKN